MMGFRVEICQHGPILTDMKLFLELQCGEC